MTQSASIASNWGSDTLWVSARCEVTTLTATTAVISYAAWWSVNYDWHMTYGDFDASGVATGHMQGMDTPSTGGTFWLCSGTVTVARTSSTQSFGEAIYFGGNSGFGAVGTQETCTVPALVAAPTIGTATRVSDAKATLTWTDNPTAAAPYEAVQVLRETDGSGSWVQVASVAGSASSYADTGVSANHRYRWRVRSVYRKSTAQSAASGYVYNTPAAPTNAKATVTSGTSVSLTWTNPANTATTSVVQRSTDGGSTWTTVATVSQASATSATDSYGGTAVYRVRNERGSLVSAWAQSNSITTLCAPAAPTLRSPTSGITLATGGSVAFSWVHNSRDSSAQTAAEVTWSPDGGTSWVASSATTASSLVIDMSGLASGTSVIWKARTKGAYDGWSDWSGAATFALAAVPTLAISSPAADGDAINAVPLVVTLDYGDEAGTLASCAVYIYDSSGNRAYSTTTTSTTITVPVSSFLPQDGTSWRISATARSTSTLSVTAGREFAVAYVPPSTPALSPTVDADDASVTLVVTLGTLSEVAALSVAVHRVEGDGTLVEVGTALRWGDSVEDRTPPLDRDVIYRATAFATSGATSSCEVTVKVPSGGYAFLNFGALDAEVAKLAMNLKFPRTFKRDLELYSVPGRENPIARYGRTSNGTVKVTGDRFFGDGVEDFRALEEHAGNVWLRVPHAGRRRMAVESIGYGDDAGSMVTKVTVSMTEVDA